MRGAAFSALTLAFVATAGAAKADVVVMVDKSKQQMSVSVDGAERYQWPVSTGRPGFGTPNGVYHPQHLARTWFSKKYYNSPMPYSIFFHEGIAIHGSYEISQLGGPASHGCVRISPSHAATLFALVQSEGADHTRIVVAGTAPAPQTEKVAQRPAHPRPVNVSFSRWSEPEEESPFGHGLFWFADRM